MDVLLRGTEDPVLNLYTNLAVVRLELQVFRGCIVLRSCNTSDVLYIMDV